MVSGAKAQLPTYRITIKLKVTPTKKAKRVAIIGAGPGGIVAAKYASESGLTPVVFDRKESPGGLWREGTAIWDGMHTNVSRYSVMFSDFPWPENSNVIPSAKEVYDYLMRYIRHFELEKYFKLNTFVESVKYLPNKKWQVTWTNNLTKERITEIFDYCICSTGVHCKSVIPKIENSENFKGVIMHSAKYKSQDERLKGKKVIIVGNSYSGVEIASHLVGFAKTVVNVFNRPYLVFPRLLKFESKNKNEKNVFHILPIDMLFGRELTFTTGTKEEERAAKIQLYSKLCPHQTNKKLAHPAMYYELNNDEPIREAVTDNYYPYVRQGKIIPRKTQIKRYEKDGVVYEDGTYEKADAVIYCTGYRLCLDYFDEHVLRTLKYDPNNDRCAISLYKFTVHPDLENLALIGKYNGLFYAGFELQAKWAIKVFTGEKPLPPREVMFQDMHKDEINFLKMKNNQYQHGVYNELIDTLAVESDSLPDFSLAAKTDPKIFEMLWKNGTIPSHFCFNSNREMALKVMREADDLINRKYYFDEREIYDCPTSRLAAKFSKNFKIPLHLFKD